MNRERMMSDLSTWWQMSEDSIRSIMDKVSFHETAGTRDPKQLQGNDITKPGKGLYQFETGVDGGGATAGNRLVEYIKFIDGDNAEIPVWLAKHIDKDAGRILDLDATILNREQQDMLFLADKRMRKGPKLGSLKTNEDIATYWADHHWAGVDHDGDGMISDTERQDPLYIQKKDTFLGDMNVYTERRPDAVSGDIIDSLIELDEVDIMSEAINRSQ